LKSLGCEQLEVQFVGLMEIELDFSAKVDIFGLIGSKVIENIMGFRKTRKVF